MAEEYLNITCGHCGTALTLRFERLASPSSDAHALGCPECQEPATVIDAWRRLEIEAVPMFLHLTLLEKQTEIGVGALVAHDPAGAPPSTEASR